MPESATEGFGVDSIVAAGVEDFAEDSMDEEIEIEEEDELGEEDFEMIPPEDEPVFTLQHMRDMQAEDECIVQVRRFLHMYEAGDPVDLAGEPPCVKSLIARKDELNVVEDLLVLDVGAGVNLRIIAPAAAIIDIIVRSHSGVGGAHEGIVKTREKISRQYYWPRMKRDIIQYISACQTCGAFAKVHRSARAPLCPIGTGDRNELIAMDLMGGKDSLPTTSHQNRYILVIVDAFTKFALAVAVGGQSAGVVVRNVITSGYLFSEPRCVFCRIRGCALSRENSKTCVIAGG